MVRYCQKQNCYLILLLLRTLAGSVPVIADDTAHTTLRMALCKDGERVGGFVEIWETDYDAPDRFTAKPLKTTYFKKGKTLTVRRKDGEGL